MLKFLNRFLRANRSRGQTLVETVVALGLLTTGIIAGLAAAIAAHSASDQSLQQIVAQNLAREGVEVVRKIRDSNWHNGTLSDCDPWFATSDDQQCYQNWNFGIAGSTIGTNYLAAFNATFNTWSLTPTFGGSATRLFTLSNGAFVHSGSGVSRYSRIIRITRDTAAPFSAANPRLHVASTVWWNNKRCPVTTNPSATTCKVVVEDYLTNWRNY